MRDYSIVRTLAHLMRLDEKDGVRYAIRNVDRVMSVTALIRKMKGFRVHCLSSLHLNQNMQEIEEKLRWVQRCGK